MSISSIYKPYLDWISAQYPEMISLVKSWSHINSGTENILGLNRMLIALKTSFSSLQGEMQEYSLAFRKIIDPEGKIVETPLGKALSIRKRTDAPIQIFLGGHMDTVFTSTHIFQKTEELSDSRLKGPGVADLKGGLVILLKGLEAFERSPFTRNVGWEILINPDEEVGSPGSAPLLKEAAKRNKIGLIFEPSFPDGAFVSARKGSANFTILSRGKSAHAGRDFHEGINAIYALVKAIHRLERLTDLSKGITVNVGSIHGGGPPNIIPDLALCKFNLRALTPEQMLETKTTIEKILQEINENEKGSLEIFQETFNLPKTFDKKTQNLFAHLEDCLMDLNRPLLLRESGGACDGNLLSNQGLPTIDSFGAVGGNMHTAEEFIFLNSLKERAELLALFLMKIGNSEISLECK